MVCDTARTRSSGILTVVGNSVPHVAVANPPPFPDGGNDTLHREEKVRYRGGGAGVPLSENSKVFTNIG